MLATLAEAAPHIWTLQTGERVTGDYVSSGTTTLVVKTGGTNCFIKISSLASDDQSYVAELKATKTTINIVRVPGKGNIIELSIPVPPTNALATIPPKPAVAAFPLIEAVKASDMDKVRAILQQSTDQAIVSDEKGLTALHWAATEGSVEIVEELLSHGAIVDARSKSGLTPLHQAARKGNLGIVKLLLEKQADVNAVDRAGMTPLIWACNLGTNGDVVKLLLNYKPEVNLTNRFGETALVAAVANGNADAVKALLDAGADVNLGNNFGGGSIMHAAVTACPIETIELLLSKKPDLTVQDGEGDTALDLALQDGRDDVAALLRQQGAITAPPTPMSETERSLVEFFKSNDLKMRTGGIEEKRSALLAVFPTKADVEQVFLKNADRAWELSEKNRAEAVSNFDQAVSQNQASDDEGEIMKIKLMPRFNPFLAVLIQHGLMASNVPIYSPWVTRRGGDSEGGNDFYFVNQHWVMMPDPGFVFHDAMPAFP